MWSLNSGYNIPKGVLLHLVLETVVEKIKCAILIVHLCPASYICLILKKLQDEQTHDSSNIHTVFLLIHQI